MQQHAENNNAFVAPHTLHMLHVFRPHCVCRSRGGGANGAGFDKCLFWYDLLAQIESIFHYMYYHGDIIWSLLKYYLMHTGDTNQSCELKFNFIILYNFPTPWIVSGCILLSKPRWFCWVCARENANENYSERRFDDVFTAVSFDLMSAPIGGAINLMPRPFYGLPERLRLRLLLWLHFKGQRKEVRIGNIKSYCIIPDKNKYV